MENKDFEVPLDNQFILSRHKIVVDNRIKSLDSLDGAKKYAKQVLKRIMHDDVEISSKGARLSLRGSPLKPGFTLRQSSKLIDITAVIGYNGSVI
jgi:hypothetical protein